jgi:hypothetical protein
MNQSYMSNHSFLRNTENIFTSDQLKSASYFLFTVVESSKIRKNKMLLIEGKSSRFGMHVDDFFLNEMVVHIPGVTFFYFFFYYSSTTRRHNIVFLLQIHDIGSKNRINDISFFFALFSRYFLSRIDGYYCNNSVQGCLRGWM